MRLASRSGKCILKALFVSMIFVVSAEAQARQPRMGIFTKEGAHLDLSLQFVDSRGQRGSLQSMLISGRPFILVPIFYKCPRLCGLTISGVVDLANRLPLVLGEDYSVVAYSFSPDDSVADASEKREKVMLRLSPMPTADAAVRFLVGSPETVAAINEQIGFRVRYADKELEHSSAIFIVSPNGEVRRYYAGIEFDPVKVGATLRGR